MKNGVVQDKLWLPGLLKLKLLSDTGFFGQILSVRGEFGYWVFEGDTVPAQRPSWNYRKEDGGGIIIDMLCHWRYVLGQSFRRGEGRFVPGRDAHRPPLGRKRPALRLHGRRLRLRHVRAGGRRHRALQRQLVRARPPRRPADAPGGRHQRERRGRLRDCWVQPYAATPRPTWNPDIDSPLSYFDGWQRLPAQQAYDNAFKVQWELFLRHVVKDEPFRWTLLEGAKGVQLAEKGIESWQKRQWVDVPDLEA